MSKKDSVLTGLILSLFLVILGVLFSSGADAQNWNMVYDITWIGDGGDPSINNKREIVWIIKTSPSDKTVFSNLRGELVTVGYNRTPSINNAGDVVYMSGWSGATTIWLYGQEEFVAATRVATPDINERGEIVYRKHIDGYWQIFSNLRGQLTFDEANHVSPSINNRGEFAWEQQAGVYPQIFSNLRGQITFDNWYNERPSINNRGEIVWRTSHGKIFSSVNGELPISGVGNPMEVSINDRGDIAIGTLDHGVFLATLSRGHKD